MRLCLIIWGNGGLSPSVFENQEFFESIFVPSHLPIPEGNKRFVPLNRHDLPEDGHLLFLRTGDDLLAKGLEELKGMSLPPDAACCGAFRFDGVQTGDRAVTCRLHCRASRLPLTREDFAATLHQFPGNLALSGLVIPASAYRNAQPRLKLHSDCWGMEYLLLFHPQINQVYQTREPLAQVRRNGTSSSLLHYAADVFFVCALNFSAVNMEATRMLILRNAGYVLRRHPLISIPAWLMAQIRLIRTGTFRKTIPLYRLLLIQILGRARIALLRKWGKWK